MSPTKRKPVVWLLVLALLPVGFVALTATWPLTWRWGESVWRLGGTGPWPVARTGFYSREYMESVDTAIDRLLPRGPLLSDFADEHVWWRTEWGLSLGSRGYALRSGERMSNPR
jgi:hypothetical protein